jgi:hypothetical protein
MFAFCLPFRLKELSNSALPSLTVFGGNSWSNGADEQVRSLANPLVRGSFASVMGKIQVPKNKLPLPAPLVKIKVRAGYEFAFSAC